MFRHTHAGVALTLALGLSVAHGSAQADAITTTLADGLSVTCSNTLAQEDGTQLSLRCGGTLTLSGRGPNDTLVQRSGGIWLEAAEDLSVGGLTLSAPSIQLISHSGLITLSPDLLLITPETSTSLSGLTLQGDVRLSNQSGLIVRTPQPITVVADHALPSSSGSIVVSSVPEPATMTLSLLGAALALAGASTRRSRGPRA